MFLFTTVVSDPPKTRHLADAASAGQSALTQGSELGSIDTLIETFYASLSFTEGKFPDWDRLRVLFASPASPCARMTADTVMEMDREGFIAFFHGRVEKGPLRSFEEKEIGRATEIYGSLAQVFITYEKRMNLADAGR